MSNQQSSSITNESITHNTYFDGQVQSLGLHTDKGKATVGVMKAGSYTFSTSSTEKMIIIAGRLEVKLNDSGYKIYEQSEEFDIASGVTFDVKCDSDVAYICYYE